MSCLLYFIFSRFIYRFFISCNHLICHLLYLLYQHIFHHISLDVAFHNTASDCYHSLAIFLITFAVSFTVSHSFDSLLSLTVSVVSSLISILNYVLDIFSPYSPYDLSIISYILTTWFHTIFFIYSPYISIYSHYILTIFSPKILAQHQISRQLAPLVATPKHTRHSLRRRRALCACHGNKHLLHHYSPLLIFFPTVLTFSLLSCYS
ncbi:uncharacterized protein RJT20DRAFT_48930 [Scheffersomyces xylosifermentans]|uniref:uncharacterized protein n=1 Tax=Scheffersomyces xylosifermentans TaxID=1304137 RepID=UPI00315D4B4F